MAARKIRRAFTKNKAKAENFVFDFFGEEFTAYGAIPGALILDYIEASENTNAAAGIRTYLAIALPEEEYKRFDAYSRDPENDVELEDLSEVVSFLIEEQTSRPTLAS